MRLEAVIRRVRADYRLRRPPNCPPGHQPGPPDFVGVGAQRSGTTWWYDLIASHPGVHDGVAKELHFFHRYSQRPFTAADVDLYARYFPRPPGARAGEWSPGYLAHFWAPPCLREAAPDARVLVLLRDPVERYVSGVGLQSETRRSGAASASAAFRLGLYGSQLEHLLRYFPAEQVLVLQFERCVKDPATELARTYEFLGLDSTFTPGDLAGARNAARRREADDRRRPSTLARAVLRARSLPRRRARAVTRPRALGELRTSRVTTSRVSARRVAVIGPLMMPNRQGGMSRHCEEIYGRLAARGHVVSIFCSSRPQGADYRGMQLRKVPALGVPGWDRLVYSILATVLATFGRYDVVHYHSLANTGFCFLPRLASKRVRRHDPPDRVAGREVGCRHASIPPVE